MTPSQWHRRKRQEAEEHTLERYPPEQRWALYDEACDIRDRLERALR